MAIIKHLAVKNNNYNAALDYMIYQHNEETNKPILDEKGRMILRDEYFIDGINCDPFSFSDECNEIDKRYNIKQTRNSIKTHHYILSFDPEDINNGLTGERAQKLGIEFAQEHFPGHKIMVCTHTDGHNGSNNIHCHIVIHSVRFCDVERKPYMTKSCEWKEGKKHWASKSFLEYIKKSVMDLCEREGFEQVDLLTPARNKIIDREYRAKQKGQKKLDKENQKVRESGLEPRKEKYETIKGCIRNAVNEAIEKSDSFNEFRNIMQEQYRIKVKITRGKISYLPPKRDKYIRGRMLGTDYEIDSIEKRIREKSGLQEIDQVVKISKDYGIPINQIECIFVKSDFRLVVDLQNNAKAQISRAYAQKVKISNLKEMALTVAFAQEHGFDSIQNVDIEHNKIKSEIDNLSKIKKEINTELKDLNQSIRFMAQYYANKKTYKDYKNSKNPSEFCEEHYLEIEKYEQALSFLKEKYPSGSLPDIGELKKKREKLNLKKEQIKSQIKKANDEEKVLFTMKANIKTMLNYQKTKSRSKENKQEI